MISSHEKVTLRVHLSYELCYVMLIYVYLLMQIYDEAIYTNNSCYGD